MVCEAVVGPKLSHALKAVSVVHCFSARSSSAVYLSAVAGPASVAGKASGARVEQKAGWRG
eukprot:266261-Alexandrium_andersonii.AAC.1